MSKQGSDGRRITKNIYLKTKAIANTSIGRAKQKGVAL